MNGRECVAETVQLPEPLLSSLKDLLDGLSVSQRELADLAKISHGTVSNALQGRTVRVDRLRPLVEALSDVLRQKRKNDALTDDVDSAGQTVLAQARTLLGGAVEFAGMARPGGPLHPNADNRLPRGRFEADLLDALPVKPGRTNLPVIMGIYGPPDSGKSTMLLRVVAEASAQGMAVARLDCTKLTVDEFYPLLARSVAREVGEASAASRLSWEADRTMREQTFLEILVDLRRGRAIPPLLIAVDHLSKMRDVDFVDDFIRLCGRFKSESVMTNASLLVAWTALSVEALMSIRESTEMFSPHIHLEWFDGDERDSLLASYEIASDRIAHDVLDLFGGQPFLTHLAVNMRAEGLPWATVAEVAREGEGQFGQHLKQLQKAIEGIAPTTDRGAVRDLLQGLFVIGSDHRWRSKYYEEQRELIDVCRQWLTPSP